MQHLPPERIAALADEPATLAERAHTTECAACGAELAAAQRLIRMAMTDTPAIERPITSWERMRPALKADGLIRTPAGPGEFDDVLALPVGRSSRRTRMAIQAAAAFLLLAGGTAMGRVSAGAPLASFARGTVSATTDTNFQSTTDALHVLQRASDDYQRAVTYLAANDSNVTMRGRDAAELYQARLDALDQAVAATRAALYRAPQDQMLNNYYLQSVGARNLTLQQMGSAIPVSATKRTKF